MQKLKDFVPAIIEIRLNRAKPSQPHTYFYAQSGNSRLFSTLVWKHPQKVVIVAHAAFTGSFYRQTINLADELSKSFSVILFDFQGHSRSEGKFRASFESAAKDLDAIIERARLFGFEKIGVAGFSMGAAAGFLESRTGGISALASVGCPPIWPEIPVFFKRSLTARAAMRLLNVRIDSKPPSGLTPLDVAKSLPPIPKLLIFGEYEVVPDEVINRFASAVTEPKQLLKMKGVWHADLKGQESLVRNWFEDCL
ncbi:MAG: alpha/beta fold hydrolase [Actinomycetota bacterium]|nr:alpha/beta fold hydrolase [Actinomycetota bacterium]